MSLLISCKSDLGFTVISFAYSWSQHGDMCHIPGNTRLKEGNYQKHPHFCLSEVCACGDSLNTTASRPCSQVSSWTYTSWDVIIIINEHRVIKVCDLVREMKQNRSECCDLLFQRNPAVSLTGLRAVAVRWVINVCVWILFSLPQFSFGILLNAALLFLLSHLLPQQLTDISQRVGFTWERPHCSAEPAGLCFPVNTIKKSGRGFHTECSLALNRCK